MKQCGRLHPYQLWLMGEPFYSTGRVWTAIQRPGFKSQNRHNGTCSSVHIGRPHWDHWLRWVAFGTSSPNMKSARWLAHKPQSSIDRVHDFRTSDTGSHFFRGINMSLLLLLLRSTCFFYSDKHVSLLRSTCLFY